MIGESFGAAAAEETIWRVVPRRTKMLPLTKRRYSVCVAWKCRPEDQVEWSGRWIVVLRGGEKGEGGVVAMWYVTAEGPGRETDDVLKDMVYNFILL